MTSNQLRNEMKVMVASDLAAIWRKPAENSAIPNALRVQAGELFDSLVAESGKGTSLAHAEGERLLIKMARFLPRIVENSILARRLFRPVTC